MTIFILTVEIVLFNIVKIYFNCSVIYKSLEITSFPIKLTVKSLRRQLNFREFVKQKKINRDSETENQIKILYLATQLSFYRSNLMSHHLLLMIQLRPTSHCGFTGLMDSPWNCVPSPFY